MLRGIEFGSIDNANWAYGAHDSKGLEQPTRMKEVAYERKQRFVILFFSQTLQRLTVYLIVYSSYIYSYKQHELLLLGTP